MILNLSFEELNMIRQAILDRLVFLQSAKIEAENLENLLERLPEVCA